MDNISVSNFGDLTSNSLSTNSIDWSQTAVTSSPIARRYSYFTPKINEEALKEEYFEKDDTDIKNTTGWRILSISDNFIRGAEFCFSFKTIEEAWPVSFRVMLKGFGDVMLVMVDQDCPDYYISAPEDIMRFVDKVLQEGNDIKIGESIFDLIDFKGSSIIDNISKNITYTVSNDALYDADTAITGTNCGNALTIKANAASCIC
jgi:hypothetical protein